MIGIMIKHNTFHLPHNVGKKKERFTRGFSNDKDQRGHF